MSTQTINFEHIARVEGHANVNLVVRDGRVQTCEMNVVEPARLFEAMVQHKSFADIAYIASRICGICSASHVITSILATERIFGMEVSERTHALRELLIYGSYLQNHASHLFVFAAPDFLGIESVFPLEELNPKLFKQALELKALGNELCTRVGGRSIHPICAVVGGFTHEPTRDEFLELADKLHAMRAFAIEAIDLFESFSVPEITTAGDMLAMVLANDAQNSGAFDTSAASALGESGAYPVCTSTKARFLESEIEFDAACALDTIEEYEMPYSAALFARVKQTGAPYFTGALARMNASWASLNKDAKVAAAKAGLRPPEKNPFKNNLAQALEILDALIYCEKLCKLLASPDDFGGSSRPVKFDMCAGRAVGFTEAPRGALFHELTLNEAGRVVHASIITPTAQNMANLEADMRQLAEKLLAEGVGEADLRASIAKLVRAYDPCFSCSVH